MRSAPLLALALCAGCRAPLQDHTAEIGVEPPATWGVAGEDASVSGERWWASFDDPELSAAIDEALIYNRDIRASLARVESAVAQARIAGADLYPSLAFNGSARRSKQIFVDLPVPGGDGVLDSTSTSYGASLDVSWEIDLWGRIAAGRDAAREDFEAAAADHVAARQSLAAQTAKSWYAWQEALLQEAQAQRTVESYERSTAIVRRRYERGRGSSLDLHRAESTLAASKALFEQRREAVTRAQRQLEILLGRYPDGSLEREARLPVLPATPAAGLPSELARRRPDLLAAEARLLASDQRLHEARALLYPRLTLTASGGRTSDNIDDLFDSDFDTWSLLGGLMQPILQGGRLSANVDLADARTREAAAQYAASLLVAFAEVETALAVENTLERREANQARASQEAQTASILAEDRYSAGLIDLTTLLDVQRAALETEILYLATRFQRLEARIDLHLALGGGLGDEARATEELEP